jgi:manganese transport protein
VGTLAGQVVMQGFIQRAIPLFLRRAITMAPALVVIAIGLNPSRALVLSQVVLSFGIPFALIPLLLFCRDRELMGSLVNHRVTTIIATGVVAVIVSLNIFLITLLVTGK